jgi:hypothetical protein
VIKQLCLGALWLLGPVLAAAAEPSTEAAVCRDATLKSLAERGGCRTFPIVWQEHGRRSAATIIEIPTDYRVDIDVIYPVITSFLRKPDGEIVSLGTRQIFTLAPMMFVFKALSVDPAYAGGLCCQDEDVFYDRHIEGGRLVVLRDIRDEASVQRFLP